MFGSANFDNRSLELNDEMNVAVSDPGLAARLLQDFEQDLPAREEARSGRVAPPLVPRKGARTLLELLRGDLLSEDARRRCEGGRRFTDPRPPILRSPTPTSD